MMSLSDLSRSDWPNADFRVSVVRAQLIMLKITMMKTAMIMTVKLHFLDISVAGYKKKLLQYLEIALTNKRHLFWATFS